MNHLEISQAIPNSLYPFSIAFYGCGDPILPLLNHRSILGIQIEEHTDQDQDEIDDYYIITFPNRKALWESIISLNNDINQCLQGYIDHSLTDAGLITDSLSDCWEQIALINKLSQYDNPYSDYHLQKA